MKTSQLSNLLSRLGWRTWRQLKDSSMLFWVKLVLIALFLNPLHPKSCCGIKVFHHRCRAESLQSVCVSHLNGTSHCEVGAGSHCGGCDRT